MDTIYFSRVKFQSIDNAGIDYIDENGLLCHVDLQTCRSNALKQSNISIDQMSLKVADWLRKCVGQRNILGNPPYIEFYTEPPVRLVFDDPQTGEDDYRNFRAQLENAGSTTHDLT